MFKLGLLRPALVGLLLVTGSAAAVAAPADTPIVAASQAMARVWFLRPTSSANLEVWGADPVISANGAPIAAIPPDTSFYRDLPAGAYNFTVQPYGLPTGASYPVQLLPGSQSYLEVQWEPTWVEGYPGGGRSNQSHAFFVRGMSPQLGQDYLRTLHYLGSGS